MKVLRGSDAEGTEHLVLLLGMGMLGRSIESFLRDAQYASAENIPIDWFDPESLQRALARAGALIRARTPRHLSLSWTAGGPGFSCTEAEARRETESLLAILDWTDQLRQQDVADSIDFHFMSSAGGLFEGQRTVNEHSLPAPMRHYGHMKLEQEQALADALPALKVAIYRPSTVYGPRRQHARHGLINNLVNDGLSGQPTVLDAHVTSLRDYVYTGDIGAFVAKRIRFPRTEDRLRQILFLVSSRCASIFEVVHIIERVLHLKLRYRLDESFGNHSNITFSHSLNPQGWSPTQLEVGVRQFVAGRHAHLPVPLGV